MMIKVTEKYITRSSRSRLIRCGNPFAAAKRKEKMFTNYTVAALRASVAVQPRNIASAPRML